MSAVSKQALKTSPEMAAPPRSSSGQPAADRGRRIHVWPAMVGVTILAVILGIFTAFLGGGKETSQEITTEVTHVPPAFPSIHS